MHTITLPFKQVFQKLIQFLVCPPPSPPPSAGQLEPPTKFSKNGGGLDRISKFRGELLGNRGELFHWGLQFLYKK